MLDHPMLTTTEFGYSIFVFAFVAGWALHWLKGSLMPRGNSVRREGNKAVICINNIQMTLSDHAFYDFANMVRLVVEDFARTPDVNATADPAKRRAAKQPAKRAAARGAATRKDHDDPQG